MASYLGHTTNVVQLVNEDNIHPDITDSLGNSAVMYATVSTSSSDKTFEDNFFFLEFTSSPVIRSVAIEWN